MQPAPRDAAVHIHEMGALVPGTTIRPARLGRRDQLGAAIGIAQLIHLAQIVEADLCSRQSSQRVARLSRPQVAQQAIANSMLRDAAKRLFDDLQAIDRVLLVAQRNAHGV